MGRKRTRDPINAYRREEVARRLAGDDARCQCGEDRPKALKRTAKGHICAACERRQQRKSVLDYHHPAGESNSALKVPIPVNDHQARVNVEQYEWPARTLQNRNRSPLLANAACIRGYVDMNAYLTDELLGRTAEMLEELDERLVMRLGRKWWTKVYSKRKKARQ
jgi:hypothetical protein